MSLESKDATCVGFLCERANSHGTRDFAGNMDLQAPFRNAKDKHLSHKGQFLTTDSPILKNCSLKHMIKAVSAFLAKFGSL